MRYKSHDGSYLKIDDSGGRYRIAWYFPSIDDIGAHLGDRDNIPRSDITDEEKREVWEMETADKAVAPFSSLRNGYSGFEFESERVAKQALAAANAALNMGSDTPMPDWAVKATAAGWKSPNGWKP